MKENGAWLHGRIQKRFYDELKFKADFVMNWIRFEIILLKAEQFLYQNCYEREEIKIII